MSMTRGSSLRIGDLVLACEDGLKAGRAGRRYRLPGWTVGSKLLARAFRTGYLNARRGKGATDGPAR